MLMKRFVGGGNDLHVYMDIMIMVFQGCSLINLLASPSAYNATATYQQLEQQRWAVVVAAIATATAAGMMAIMAAVAAAKTTAATA
jgi:hypothetical protein